MLAILVTLTAVAAAAADGGGATTPRRTPPRPDVPTSAAIRVAEILRAWDRRRAAAWARGEPAGLARLYTPGSRTGAGDVADLRRWRDRGLRVVGLRQQVAGIGLRRHTRGHLVLTVTERTVDGIAVGRRRTALPVSGWETHVISLRHVHGRWLVDEVVAQPAR